MLTVKKSRPSRSISLRHSCIPEASMALGEIGSDSRSYKPVEEALAIAARTILQGRCGISGHANAIVSQRIG